MSIEQVTLQNIQLGDLVKEANKYLAEISQDVINRCGIKKPRTLTIEISIAPVVEKFGDRQTNNPTIDWNVKKNMPGCKGIVTRAFVDGQKVMINTNDPLSVNPDQTNVFDMIEIKQADAK